jgi:hypothetical protein
MTEFGSWKQEPDLDSWVDGATCSFCGPLRPDLFIEAIVVGAEICPTDKSYKCYVALADNSHQKFYFQHLSEQQREHFIDLHKSGMMRLAHPGRFYVRPFFVDEF